MRIAALVKQVPAFEEMQLGPDGRLVREGIELEMNPYCRRAVAQAVELAAAVGDGTVTVLTLGPPSAGEVLREAIAWGAAADVLTEGVLITDPALAGSDTLATATALAAGLALAGPFDLVVVGRNSVDADTGQVGPQLAELLDWPFAAGVRNLSLQGESLHLRCEHDDGWMQAEIVMPAVISVAERLIDPCKVPPDERAAVSSQSIRTVSAADLGPGPWGQPASPTTVGEVRVHEVARERIVLDGPVLDQVRAAVQILVRRGALDAVPDDAAIGNVASSPDRPGALTAGPPIAVIAEAGRPRFTRELLGSAAGLAGAIGGHVVLFTQDTPHPAVHGGWGADEVVGIEGDLVEEDIAGVVSEWGRDGAPWAILAPSTAWGREVAGRVAVQLGAGLTGDAIDLEPRDGRLCAWKPAFGGQLVVAIHTSSPCQMATVRAGVLPALTPRTSTADVRTLTAAPRGRVHVASRTRDDDLDVLAEAPVVVGVGQVVAPEEYPSIQPLLDVLDGKLAATRKVTDRGWLPRARQLGITGRTITPRLYIALGVGGKFAHMVGARSSGTILAVNADRDARVFASADVGIVADWHDVIEPLVSEIERARKAREHPGT